MNWFDKIKLLFKLNSIVKEDIQEAKKMDGLKPGWKTTEFWGKIAVQVMTIFAAVKGFLPAQYAALGTIGLEAIYNIGRTIAKAVSDSKAVTATATSPTVVVQNNP